MTFPFASWECAHSADDSLNSVTTLFGQYLLKCSPHRNWLFFRPIHSQEEASFVIASSDRRNVPSPPNPGVLEVTIRSPIEELEVAIEENRICRAFFLDEQENLRRGASSAHHLIVVSAQGWAQWNGVITIPEDPVRFWLRDGREFLWSHELNLSDFLSISAPELWAQIVKQRDDPSSDCAFAYRTRNWSRDDWNHYFFRWKKGTHVEFQAVLSAALLSQTSLWEKATGYAWLVDLDNLQTSWHRGRLLPLNGQPLSWKGAPLAPGILRDVLHRVAPYFEPAFDEELVNANLATEHQIEHARLLSYESYDMGWPLWIRVNNPTSHERLEAKLFWEEWQDFHPVVG